MDWRYLFTSLDGRINRAKWWVGAAIIMAIGLAFCTGVFGSFLATLFALALFYPSYAVCAKRFQDRGRPGQTALFGLVPVGIATLLYAWGLTGSTTELGFVGGVCMLIYLGVGLWFLIDLGLLKGTPGQNQFGGDPLIT